MKQANRSKSSLFLMEMIVVILFFALTSAICIGLFAKAHLTAQDSVELSQAVMLAESAAETLKACGGDLAAAGAALGAETDADGALQAGFDRSWQSTGDAPVYTLRITQDKGQPVRAADIVVVKDGAVLYQLLVKTLNGEASQ